MPSVFSGWRKVCAFLARAFSVSKFQQAEVGDFVMRCPLLFRFVLQCASIFTVVAVIMFGAWIL